MKNFALAGVMILVFVASGCTSTTPQTAPAEGGDTPSNPENMSNPEEDNQTRYTVSYTGSGFSPSEITIDPGDTVVWKDDSSGGMWVGSDRHPTHTQYDSTSTGEHCRYPRDSDRQERIGNPFDSCASVQSFSYTFNKTGEWSYHNHLNAIHGGTVTVR